jgi:hypothetical protein
LFLAEFLLVKDFGNRPDSPFERSFDDGVQKDLAVMVTGKGRLGVEVNGASIPAL